uniref:hypothetical protein n=1 Tax=Kitasatospora sp. NBC_01519 TaxID=2903576 RepID=UPI002F91B6E9
MPQGLEGAEYCIVGAGRSFTAYGVEDLADSADLQVVFEPGQDPVAVQSFLE